MAAAGGGDWCYDWMPASAVAALCHLLQASILRSFGKRAPAAAHLSASQEAVAQQLAALGLHLEASVTG